MQINKRYLNNQEIKIEEMKDIKIQSEIILDIIKKAKKRIAEHSQKKSENI